MTPPSNVSSFLQSKPQSGTRLTIEETRNQRNRKYSNCELLKDPEYSQTPFVFDGVALVHYSPPSKDL